MSEEEELLQLGKVDPKVVQALLQFRTYKEIKRLNERLGAYIRFMGPMTRMFKRELQYQYATVKAGESKTVWFMRNPQPQLLVGIITQVANSWYPNTYLEWFIDHYPKKIEYVIGDVEKPKHFERGIPFHGQVKWVAHNEDTVAHTFEVLCDGFFIPKKIFNSIVGR